MASDTFPAALPAHLQVLRRHFIDLRDGRHGDNAVSREDKERLFTEAVGFLDLHARQALEEINQSLLLATGTVMATGVLRSADGGATWALSLDYLLQGIGDNYRDLDVELAGATGAPHFAYHTGGLFRQLFPPPASARSNSRQLAFECL